MLGIMIVLLVAAAQAAPTETQLYKLDTDWAPKYPEGGHTYSGVGVAWNTAFEATEKLVFITQRGNASVAPVLVFTTKGELIAAWGKNTIGLDKTKPSAATWGSHGIVVENCNYPCVSGEPYPFVRVWVDDFTNHTLTAFSAYGKQLLQLGTPGIAGNGTDPLQFGNVADSAVQPGDVAPAPAPVPGAPPSPPVYGPNAVYSSDGDGGTANRVVKISVPFDGEPKLEWATPHIYHNPHSIALHTRSQLLIVADREHNETRILRADTGDDLGVWDCGLDLGAQGRPFGVRTWADKDLAFVAIMDNPQDGLNMRIAVLDASGLNAKDGAKSKCSVLQQLEWNQDVPATFSGPHLLGVDDSTGDLYAALVADVPESTVLRFLCQACK